MALRTACDHGAEAGVACGPCDGQAVAREPSPWVPGPRFPARFDSRCSRDVDTACGEPIEEGERVVMLFYEGDEDRGKAVVHERCEPW